MVPSGGGVGSTKATAILKRPNEDLVMHIRSFGVYAYDSIAGIVNIINLGAIYIPFESQPRDFKIQTSIAPCWLHSKSLCLRTVSLVLRAVRL